MTPIRVMIVDDVQDTREDIKRLLYFEEDIQVVAEAGDGIEAVSRAKEVKPDVILMDINMPHLDGIGATGQITLDVAESAVIIISIQGEQDYLRKAMAAGAGDYLVKPFSSNELSDTIRRVNEAHKKRSTLLSNLKGGDLSSPAKPQSQTITFFSTKGGMGKTTLATNLAVYLAAEQRKKVVILDFDLISGDTAILLNISIKSTVADLVLESEDLSFTLVNSFLVPHMSGAFLLPAPLTPEQAELVHPEQVKQILSIFQESFDYIIVDTAPVYNDINLKVLEASDLILLVLNQDLTTLKHTKTALDIFKTLSYLSKTRLVLNQYGKGGLKLADIEKALKLSMTAIVPEDTNTVRNSINKGTPFVIGQRQGQMTGAIKEMISKVGLPVEEEVEKTGVNNSVFTKLLLKKRSTSPGS
ncbi:MAG TPA: response regulator/pilus assembly protein [Clostridia bacterium]|nr:response regulator/pilus assembly protein [Clostridia bacterium]